MARLLAARSEIGYTSVVKLALPGEPEAVDREEQQRLTDRAREAARARQAGMRRDTLAELRREYLHHRAMTVHLEREIKKLERKLARAPLGV